MKPIIDMTPRYAPDFVLSARHGSQLVRRYVAHSPGAHPKGCPLVSDCVALECVTDVGSRWYGVAKAWINCELRVVIMGTNPSDEVRMRWPICIEI